MEEPNILPPLFNLYLGNIFQLSYIILITIQVKLL